MSIKPCRNVGATLVETIVALAIGTVLTVATAQLYMLTNRNFLAQFNYVDLDSQSRAALDTISQQIRQAQYLTNFSTTNIALVDTNGSTYTFTYNAASKKLIETKGSSSTVLLKGCDSLQFAMFQKTPSNGNGDFTACTNASSCKLIQLTWSCSRDLINSRAHTESIQTAKVMLRNKK